MSPDPPPLSGLRSGTNLGVRSPDKKDMGVSTGLDRIFKDDDAMVNKKLIKVLGAGLKAILCIGETKDEYEAGLNKMVRGHPSSQSACGGPVAPSSLGILQLG